jgi:hypothetical protein
MLLRVLLIAFAIAIVVYGIIQLIRLFSGWKLTKRDDSVGDKSLSDLEEQAKKVASDKETILGEVQKNKEKIDNINNNLNQ